MLYWNYLSEGRIKGVSLPEIEVLILVILELPLGENRRRFYNIPQTSLNPCYTGITSRSGIQLYRKILLWNGLNPCYTGITSRSY